MLAAYGGGGMNTVKVRADGGLADVEEGTAVQHEGGSGADPARQDKPHPHSGFVCPSSSRVVVSDLGQDKLYSYNINSATGTLSGAPANPLPATPLCTVSTPAAAPPLTRSRRAGAEHKVVETAPGSGPRHIAFHPSGEWLFGINEMDCTIVSYPYSAESGEIGAAAATVSTLPEGYDNKDHANNKNAEGNPASGPNSPGQTNACADIHVTPDGKFLYGSNRGHDSLVCFAIGEGTPAAPTPCRLGAASARSRGQVAR